MDCEKLPAFHDGRAELGPARPPREGAGTCHSPQAVLPPPHSFRRGSRFKNPGTAAQDSHTAAAHEDFPNARGNPAPLLPKKSGVERLPNPAHTHRRHGPAFERKATPQAATRTRGFL